MLIPFSRQLESQAHGGRLAAKEEMARRDIQESVIGHLRGSRHPAYALLCCAGDVSDRLLTFVKLLLSHGPIPLTINTLSIQSLSANFFCSQHRKTTFHAPVLKATTINTAFQRT